MDIEKYTDRSRGFLQNAEKLASRHNNQYIVPAHLLYAMLEDSQGLAANLLSQSGADVENLKHKVKQEIMQLPTVEGQSVQLSVSQDFMKVMDTAEQMAQRAKDAYVSVERLLQALLTFKSYDVDLFTAKTALISQRYDITDLLQIPVFTFNNNNYLVDVPVMLKSDFEANTLFYLDKIKDFIDTFNFEDNRMVSDNLEFRMLNTDKISSYILLNSIIQGKNLYKNMNYIDNVNVIAIGDNPDTVPGNNEAWIINGTPVDIVSTNIDGSSLDIYGDLGYAGLLNAPDNSTKTNYSITLDGDYTEKIKSGHIIRIKDCVTNNINGEYHVVSSELLDNNQTIIYVLEKIEKSSTEGQVYYATYEPWRILGPDNLAIYKLTTKSWEVQKINVNDIVTVSQPNYDTYYYTKNYKYQEYVLRLPLKMILNIIANKNYVIQNSIDLEEQRNMIKLQVARYLQLFNTGTDIVYYPAQIIDFVLMERPWIKSVIVINTDSSEEPFELINGLEALPENEIRDNISTSKMDILKYTSSYYYWDVDNIIVNVNLN